MMTYEDGLFQKYSIPLSLEKLKKDNGVELNQQVCFFYNSVYCNDFRLYAIYLDEARSLKRCRTLFTKTLIGLTMVKFFSEKIGIRLPKRLVSCAFSFTEQIQRMVKTILMKLLRLYLPATRRKSITTEAPTISLTKKKEKLWKERKERRHMSQWTWIRLTFLFLALRQRYFHWVIAVDSI